MCISRFAAIGSRLGQTNMKVSINGGTPSPHPNFRFGIHFGRPHDYGNTQIMILPLLIVIDQ